MNNQENEAQNRPVCSEIGYPALLSVASSPHERAKRTTAHLMYDVLIALLPAFAFGVYRFGWYALLLGAVSVLACTVFEGAYQKIMHKPVTVTDGSAAVTGLLLAMNLPATTPIPILLCGDLFAILLVKQLFGGLGKNIVNPALAARVFLFLSFPQAMANFESADAVTGATPLSSLKAGELLGVSVQDAFLGTTAGCIGEVSAVLLLLGGVYLVLRRVITPHIPLAYLGTVAALTFIFPRTDARLESMLLELCLGGVMLGAIFMATDYATSPVTPRGRILYGCLAGALTVFIRYFGSYPEGVSFAILISNLLVYYIDRFTRPTPFGKRRCDR